MPDRSGYWSQESQKRRALIGGILIAGIGLFMLLFTDNSGDGRYGTPGWLIP